MTDPCPWLFWWSKTSLILYQVQAEDLYQLLAAEEGVSTKSSCTESRFFFFWPVGENLGVEFSDRRQAVCPSGGRPVITSNFSHLSTFSSTMQLLRAIQTQNTNTNTNTRPQTAPKTFLSAILPYGKKNSLLCKNSPACHSTHYLLTAICCYFLSSYSKISRTKRSLILTNWYRWEILQTLNLSLTLNRSKGAFLPSYITL